MNIIKANAGEMVYNGLVRALDELLKTSYSQCIYEHNGVRVTINRQSCINDLCDKYDLQRKINMLENK